MKRLIVLLLGLALSACMHTPAAAQTVSAKTVSACGTPGNTPVVGVPYPVTMDTTGVLCTNASGGGGGGVAGLTAEATASAVAAGTNKPQSEDTVNGAARVEVCIPSSTTCLDLSAPSGVLGVNGTTIATVANPFPTQTVANAAGGSTPISKSVPANTTSVAICTSACTLYGLYVQTISATPLWLKLYNTAQGSVTCGTPTPVDRILIPASATGAGAVIPIAGGVGAAYGTALTACVTTGIADNDTGAPTVSQSQISYYVK